LCLSAAVSLPKISKKIIEIYENEIRERHIRVLYVVKAK
jgi:hypothetical protein